MRLILAKVVFAIHLASIVFLLFGCLFPLSVLPFHMILIPLVILQWWFNDNHCILTQLQLKLEGKTITPGEGGTFIRDLFAKVGLSPTDRQLLLIIYGLLLMSFSISLFRAY